MSGWPEQAFELGRQIAAHPCAWYCQLPAEWQPFLQPVKQQQKGDKKMRRIRAHESLIAAILSVALLLGMFGSVAAQQRHRHRRHHHSRTKGALIGGGVGAGGGALVGGRKGALIGGGAGAGTGYLIQRHRNRRHRRRQ